MDACETIYVQNDGSPGEMVRWLHIFAWELTPPRYGALWAVGPRDYTGLAGAPVAYETVALYATAAGWPCYSGELAFSMTFLPLHRRCFALELRRWSPPLPVALETVVRHFTAYFSESRTTVSDAAPLPRGRGAPPLACNSWLEAQLRALPPRISPRVLFPQWIEQYRMVRGVYPVEPDRSFRAAVDGCHRRMRTRRNNGRLRTPGD